MRGQPERGPVDRNEYPASRAVPVEVEMGPDSFLGVHMNVGPRFVVGADRQQGEIERPVLRSDLGEATGVSGVATEVRATGRPEDGPGGPQGVVAG